jgi:hypothetical protein
LAYQHISNLYKDQRILLFKEVYALEKIHGTSAHVALKDGQLRLFSGGEKHENFAALFDQPTLAASMGEIARSRLVTRGLRCRMPKTWP